MGTGAEPNTQTEKTQAKQRFALITMVVRAALLAYLNGISSPYVLLVVLTCMVICLVLYGIEMALTQGRALASPTFTAFYRSALMIFILALLFQHGNIWYKLGVGASGGLFGMLLYLIELAIRKLMDSGKRRTG